MNITFTYEKKPFELYVSFDPAIDQDKSDIKAYISTRDPKHLQFKPGMTPTKFYIKNLPRALFLNSIATSTNPIMQAMLCFQYGIERIDNLKETFCNEGVSITNNGLSSWEPTEILTVEDLRLRYISSTDMQNVFNFQTILEVASVVLKKTQSIPGIKPDYPVLPTSIEIIERMKS